MGGGGPGEDEVAGFGGLALGLVEGVGEEKETARGGRGGG